MTKVVWGVLKQDDKFFLTQTKSDVWTFPSGILNSLANIEHTIASQAISENVGIEPIRARRLCTVHKHCQPIDIIIFDSWHGEMHKSPDISATGWFSIRQIYELGEKLCKEVGNSMLLVAYLTQHYNSHPDQWKDEWRYCGDNVKATEASKRKHL